MVHSNFYELPSYTEILFDKDIQLLPSVTELFELELAFMEYKTLPRDKLIERSGYLKSINGNYTQHFLLYNQSRESLTEDRSALTKSYFENGTFSTGYATHGLFPYRGKFHPQLIKALLNIISVQKGETILDPMCGSGTTNIEAALMGINSYAVDISPFCQFMTRVKFEALTLSNDSISVLKNKHDQLFKFFSTDDISDRMKKIKELEKLKVYNFALLAFLDALGYSKRVIKSNHNQLFEKVLSRYLNTVSNFLKNPHFERRALGNVEILQNSDARKLELNENSIDGIITSPPYSFAIDYIKNDEAQLKYLGYNVEELKINMIGLVGKTKADRLKNYFHDMDIVCSEVHRVLKKEKYFVMIIGSNTHQTGGIRLENTVIKSCEKVGLSLVKNIIKPIKGMRNTMKDEYVLIFRKR